MSLRDVVNRSVDLARAGDIEAALALLNVELAKGESVGLLTRHAAVLSEAAGDLERARQYYEEGVRCSPRDPMALYGLATILEKLGMHDEARAQARAAYAECRDSVTLVEQIARPEGLVPTEVGGTLRWHSLLTRRSSKDDRAALAG